jgi:trimethylamine--corrinoid protein Co-methyltransferase
MRLNLLSETDAQAIHRAALKILCEIGLAVKDLETREMLKKAGCQENSDGYLLYTEKLIERIIATVPSKMILYDRNGQVAVDSSGTRPYFGPGLNCVNILDHRSGEHRLCSLKDIEATARLCDRLPNIDFAAGLGNPSDVPPTEQAIATVRALAEATTKPLAFIGHNDVEAEQIWNYLADLAGGWEAFSARPFAIDLTGPSSPLELGEEACKRLRFAARHHLPIVCYPAIIPGMNSPISMAGALAQSAAEILAGIAIHQLEQPGAPVISGSSILPMDMHTAQIAYGSPEYMLACLGAVDYFNHLGVPSWFGAGCSDAHTVDTQAAAEAGMNLQTAVMSGTSFIHNLGYLSAGKTGSLEMLVLCDELAGMAKSFSSGIQVNEDTLAVEVTRRAYKNQSYIKDKHTIQHVRTAMWKPALFRRTTLENWHTSGSETLQKRTRARLMDLLAS